MPITECYNVFFNNILKHKLQKYQNRAVQLWHFPITKNNLSNYDYELLQKDKIWSEPESFNKFSTYTNICIVTQKDYTELYLIKSSKTCPRTHWDKKYIKTISLHFIGKLFINSNDIASKLCNYKRWPYSGKFQPIQRVIFRQFLNNLNDNL